MQFCQFWAEIHALAPPRFGRYADSSDHDELNALARYVWNLELCGALYKPLHFLEVGLRNSVHNAMTRQIGRDDWFDNASLLRESERTLVVKARHELKRKREPTTPDKIVAALNFGFWTTLFSKHYDHRVFTPFGAEIFPNLKRSRRTRIYVARHLEDARKLRNRVFHHEPIWHFENLLERHAMLQESIRMVSTPMHITNMLTDEFEHVHKSGWQRVRNKLDTTFETIDESIKRTTEHRKS